MVPIPIKNWYNENQKEIFDKVHQQKITISDAILVLNKFAYLGESTLKEIKYTRFLNRTTYFLESWGYGIGSNHTEQCQRVRDFYQVPNGFGSPISTVTSVMRPDPWDLLPDAGLFRRQIVNRFNLHNEDVMNKYKEAS